MHSQILALLSFFLLSCSTVKEKKYPSPSALEEVASFPGAQVTGVTVSDDGRIFANFPRWRKNVPLSVVEIFPGGSSRPYPDENWNAWDGKGENGKFISAQSVLAQGEHLYVLDSGAPIGEDFSRTPKLYRFKLKDNSLDKVWTFDKRTALHKSYFNDLRVDEEEGKILITDSGLGGIIVLDMNTGESKRLLDNHPSTQSADGIALSPLDNKLYYHALRDTLYRVPVSALHTDMKHETELVKQVEKVGKAPALDGMIFDEKGNLYMGDVEKNSIKYLTPEGELKTLIQDKRIRWPDTFAIDNHKNLIFTDSLLQEASPGKKVEDLTFKIYKVPLPQD